MTQSTSDVAVCCSSDSLKIIGALAQFVEQPRVLDRDHGLIGEFPEQLDVLVGERPHLGATHEDRAERLAFAKQRHAKMVREPYFSASSRPSGKS